MRVHFYFSIYLFFLVTYQGSLARYYSTGSRSVAFMFRLQHGSRELEQRLL